MDKNSRWLGAARTHGSSLFSSLLAAIAGLALTASPADALKVGDRPIKLRFLPCRRSVHLAGC